MPDWNTRRGVRSQPIKSRAETELRALLDAYERRAQRLNDEYLRRMGEHIADIGTLWPSDVHRLQQIRRMNRNLRDIQRRLASVAGTDEGEIEKVFRRVAGEDARMATRILGVPDAVSVAANPPLRRILEAQARETAGRMRNLSNTTVESSYYRKAVDEACAAVQSGAEDYNSAIRRVVREAGAHGLRVRDDGSRAVDYESGHSRRLDSAARMNVLDGVRHLNQSVMEEVGRQFGANGVEIDAHMLCAEDHAPYQGQQYSNEEFEDIQDSLDRPFGEWNCRHSWHGIILGVSPPAYTPEELEEMRRYSTEEITVDGRTKTRYQWSQEMRRCEVRVRQLKDAANLARTTGDAALRRDCQGQIAALNRHYETLANRVGIGPEFQRTYVPGFRDVRAGKELQNSAKSGIMNLPREELFRKGNPSREGLQFIGEQRFNELTINARKNGAKIIRGDPTWEKHLIDNDAAASTIGDTIIFRQQVTVSEVLEETRHFEQNRIGLNDDKPAHFRIILNEIEARQFIFQNAKKYQVPRNEIEFLQEQMRELQRQLDEYEKG